MASNVSTVPAAAAHEDHGHSHSHGGPKTYLTVLLSLLALTVVTVLVARNPLENNLVNIIIALGIASVKATLVGLYFMHLKDDSAANGIILLVSFVLVGLLILFSLMDLGNRDTVMPGNYKPPQGIEVPEFAQEQKGGGGHTGHGEAGKPAGAAQKGAANANGEAKPAH